MNKQQLGKKLLRMQHEIDAFTAQCEENEYTDVGDIWELVLELRAQLACLRNTEWTRETLV